MKFFAFLIFNLSLPLYAGENEAAYIKSISNYISNHPNDFFTYRAEGESKEQIKYVPINKNAKTGQPDFSIASGGSFPAGTLLPTMGKPVSYIKGLFYFQPKDSYDIETISINFSDSSGKKQSLVCVITDYKLCGEAQISSCATMENGKGNGKKGYSAAPLQNSFRYNQDLFQKCEDKKNEVNNSRMKGKVIEPSPSTEKNPRNLAR